jgi:hypothetical protein
MKPVKFIKTYNIFDAQEKIKYLREKEAYNYFNSKQVRFVPKLIKSSKGVLNIEFIDGQTLFDHLSMNLDADWGVIIDQIIEIDKFLYKNKINALGLHLKDFMIKKSGEVFLYDFEYTILNSEYKNLIYDQLIIYSTLKGLADIDDKLNLSIFLDLIKKRKNDFYRLTYRRIKNKLIVIFRKIIYLNNPNRIPKTKKTSHYFRY